MLLLGCHNMQLGMGADFVPTNTLLVTAEASWIFLTVVNDSLTAKYWLHFTEEKKRICATSPPHPKFCVLFSVFLRRGSSSMLVLTAVQQPRC